MKSEYEINKKFLEDKFELKDGKEIEEEKSSTTAAKSATTSKSVKILYDKIESIRSTISMVNAERAELWIQRQNLQDLYHQIILSDIDFTIDKKLEQELWNNVFKTQINYFQSQIKENSSSSGSGSGGVGGGGSSSQTPNVSIGASASSTQPSSTTNFFLKSKTAAACAQKKAEVQANLSFFLESARGFYTRLLEDLLLKYDMPELSKNLNLISKPVCSTRKSAISKRTKKKAEERNDSLSTTNSSKVEKQLLYICQHILTHLGDIARYQSLYDEAKTYYLHAIRLLPYLGHPYNQLGILFETSRTNQLSTVFYYMRSIATRYTFPLASTNLENFFKKLIDIPLSRYMPSITSGDNKNVAIKLPHMDLITLFLQLNAIFYSTKKTAVMESKLTHYFELFKTSFVSFIQTPMQKERLDALQLSQMVSIVLFHLNNPQSNAIQNLNDLPLELLLFLVEQFVFLVLDSTDLVLTPLYIAFSFIEHFKSGSLIVDNALWKFSTSIDKYVPMTVKVLNEFSQVPESKNNLNDFPLNEDRMLESYLPMKEAHKQYSFKKTVINHSGSDEVNLRKRRIFEIFERVLKSLTEKKCYLRIQDEGERFLLSEHCPIVKEEDKPVEPDAIVQQPTVLQQQQPIRKKRQNVAIASIIGETQDKPKPQFQNLQKPPQPQQPQQPISINAINLTQQQNQQQKQHQQLQQHQPNQQQTQNMQKHLHHQNIPQWPNNLPPLLKQPPQMDNSFFPSASIRQFPSTNLNQFQQQQLANVQDFQSPTGAFSTFNRMPMLNNNNPSVLNNNGFPTFLPGVDNFQGDMLNKSMPVFNRNIPVNLENTMNKTNQQQNEYFKLLLQQQLQQKMANSFQRPQGATNFMNFNQQTGLANSFDVLKNQNSNIWSLGNFPSSTDNNKISPNLQPSSVNLNPSMESWQKGLNPQKNIPFQDQHTNINFPNYLYPPQVMPPPLPPPPPQLGRKDEQKSFEFNLNMMNIIHNTLGSSSSSSTSSLLNPPGIAQNQPPQHMTKNKESSLIQTPEINPSIWSFNDQNANNKK